MELFYEHLSDIKVGILKIIEENTVATYIDALAVILIGTLLIVLFKIVVNKIFHQPFIARHIHIRQDVISLSFKRFFTLLHVLPFFWAINFLKMPPELFRILEVLFSVIFLLAGVRFASAVTSFSIHFILLYKHPQVDPSTGKALMPIFNILIWAIALTFFLDNLGFKVSTIIAGLGIMGIALGLAGQAILTDFFSYLVILLDKPFQIGEFVSINGFSGTVERIGVKTTQIRSLTNEIIVCSNSEMTKGFLKNYSDIGKRRISLVLPLPFGMSATKIEEFSAKMKEIVEARDDCEFKQAVLLDFGPWFMNFELAYTISYGELTQALEVQHQINLKALAYLESQGISLANPPTPIVSPSHTTGSLRS